MEYTIKALAELAGLTTRTLRWYDSLGLLKPRRVTETGYRLYGGAEVDRLQQVLFYRELGLELADIRRILDDPAFNREAALQSHLAALEERKTRLENLILTVQHTLKEGQTMSDREKFEGFKENALRENEEKYGTEIREKYGEDVVEQSNKQFRSLTKAQFEEMNSLAAQIQERLEKAVAGGLEPVGEEGLAIAALHRRWLTFTWPSYSPQAHAGLGEMYVADERFTAYYDAKVPGCAAFLRGAIGAYVKTV
ncbi:TipAS antibiotic-recognition domain protein [uncultured Eubacteriales bacterium]|uniref:TipAS antibiotic-recognition domain protein n=1 Tax=uncultured Eubacteriales bacterium TaxID=172733 RepID=A0A212K8U6_9FIRM|nr:TipAS antibiotic-recognition domain protein [uncultured Eubacteriales bacterium]